MKTLYLFSYGLRPSQLTLEALAVMKKCAEVYTHCLDPVSAMRFRDIAPSLRLNTGLGREATARAAAAALDRHDAVGFLTYGNPLFLNQTAAEVLKAAARKGASVRVVPGVSSFDALVNVFRLNKFSPHGLRVVDAASLGADQQFTPGMDTLVFVPDTLNCAGREPAREKFIVGAAEAYPPSAPAFLAECASICSEKDAVTEGTVGGLRLLLEKAHERHTLFLPAVTAGGRRRPAASGPTGPSAAPLSPGRSGRPVRARPRRG